MMLSSQNAMQQTLPIRACTTSAKWTSKEVENQQDKQQRPEKEDRAGGKGKSKAKGHTLQELVYRQEATPEARNHRPTEDQWSSIGTAITAFVFTVPLLEGEPRVTYTSCIFTLSKTHILNLYIWHHCIPYVKTIVMRCNLTFGHVAPFGIGAEACYTTGTTNGAITFLRSRQSKWGTTRLHWVMWCHLHWYHMMQMVSLMTLFHSLGQDQNEVQHDILVMWHH